MQLFTVFCYLHISDFCYVKILIEAEFFSFMPCFVPVTFLLKHGLNQLFIYIFRCASIVFCLVRLERLFSYYLLSSS